MDALTETTPAIRQFFAPAVVCSCGKNVGFVHPETHEFVRSEDVEGQYFTITPASE